MFAGVGEMMEMTPATAVVMTMMNATTRPTVSSAGVIGARLAAATGPSGGAAVRREAGQTFRKRLSVTPEPTAPTFDEGYSFGGLPTGRGGKFTASEIPEAMAEINEGRVQAAQRAKEQKAQQ